MNLINRQFKQKVLQKIRIGMLCTVCCTAFFLEGCGRQPDTEIILAPGSSEMEASVMTEVSAESDDGVPVSGDFESGTETADDAEDDAGQTETLDGSPAAAKDGETAVVVYICGEVKNPGVYNLKKGDRICDAVEAAGGMTEDAAETYWNLAEELKDGDMIYIPTEAEAREREDSAGGSSDRETAETESEESGMKEAEDTRININTADVSELTEIPGVGEARAAAIVEYRRKNGSFASIEEITQVSGIGDSLFAKMKDSIRVE